MLCNTVQGLELYNKSLFFDADAHVIFFYACDAMIATQASGTIIGNLHLL